MRLGHATLPSQINGSLFLKDIWITETQLTSAWARFVHTLLPRHSRRRNRGVSLREASLTSNQQVAGIRYLHSSEARHERNVPGPLEARKRAIRRRMTELSTTPAPPAVGGQYDPSLFSGIGNYLGRPQEPLLYWKPPGKSPEIHKDSRLRWLFDFSNAATPVKKSTADQVFAEEHLDLNLSPEALSNNEFKKDQWFSKLLSCESLADIRRQAIRNKVSLRDLTASRMAFQRLMDLGDDVSCLEFLSDRTMNPLTSHNSVFFLESKYLELSLNFQSTSESTVQATQRLQAIEEWIHKEVSLGSMSEEEIRCILALPQKIHQDASDQQKSLWMTPNTIMLIWNALKASSVRGIHDLENATVIALFVSAARLRRARSAVALASEMFSQLQLGHQECDCEKAAACLVAFAHNFMPGIKEDIPLNIRNARVIGKEDFLSQILSHLPIRIAAYAATRLFEQLLKRGRPDSKFGRNISLEEINSNTDSFILQGWLEDIISSPKNLHFIESIRKEPSLKIFGQVEKEIAQGSPRLIAAYLQSFANSRDAITFISKYCFPRSSLFGRTSKLCRREDLDLIQSTNQPGISTYLEFLDSIRSVRPASRKKIALRLFSILKYVPNERTLEEFTKELRSQQVLSLEELAGAIKSLSHFNHTNAIMLAQIDDDLEIECLPVLAITILEQPCVNKDILFRLIINRVRRDRLAHLSRVHAPLSKKLLGFLLFVANRVAISTNLNYNFVRRKLWRISKILPQPSLTDRAHLISLASNYEKFLPKEPVTFPELFVDALIFRRLREGRLVPMGIQDWLVPRIEVAYKAATSSDIRTITEEWTRKNWLAYHRERKAERHGYNKAMKRMRSIKKCSEIMY